MEQICINSPENIVAVISMVVAGVSTVVNFIPSPDKIDNKILKFISRAMHFVSFDIVTAKK